MADTSRRPKTVNVSSPAILFYSAEMRTQALRKEIFRKRTAVTQRRRALMIKCAYRTVSDAAVLVFASTAPIVLLALERQKIWRSRDGTEDTSAKMAAKMGTDNQWEVDREMIPRLDESLLWWTGRCSAHLLHVQEVGRSDTVWRASLESTN